MKRGRDFDDDEVEEQPEKYLEISSQPDEIFGSQQFSPEGPGSPFAFDSNPAQSPSISDSQSLSDSESPYGSQPLLLPGSPLTEDSLAFLQSQLNEFLGETMMELERAVNVPLAQYPDAFKGQDETTIEAVLSTLGSFEPVTTSPTIPLDRSGNLDAPMSFTTRGESVVQETREEVDEVAEVAEVAEEVLDEETSLYISRSAEEIFDDAVKEFLDDAIRQAAQNLSGIEYSIQDLRMEILYDPGFNAAIAQARSQNLEDLKSEIWQLLQQEENSVEG